MLHTWVYTRVGEVTHLGYTRVGRERDTSAQRASLSPMLERPLRKEPPSLPCYSRFTVGLYGSLLPSFPFHWWAIPQAPLSSSRFTVGCYSLLLSRFTVGQLFLLLCNPTLCGGFPVSFTPVSLVGLFPFHCWTDIPLSSPVSLLG